MRWSGKIAFMLIVSIVTGGVIAAYWGSIYQKTGLIPTTPETFAGYTLPFTVSRWWDILLGPLISCTATALVAYANNQAGASELHGQAILSMILLTSLIPMIELGILGGAFYLMMVLTFLVIDFGLKKI